MADGRTAPGDGTAADVAVDARPFTGGAGLLSVAFLLSTGALTRIVCCAPVTLSRSRRPGTPGGDNSVPPPGAGFVAPAGLLYQCSTRPHGRIAPAGAAVPRTSRGEEPP